MFAAYGGLDKCLEELIFAGADLNKQNEDGHTSLYIAVEKGNLKCIEELLNASADVNISDNKGNYSVDTRKF